MSTLPPLPAHLPATQLTCMLATHVSINLTSTHTVTTSKQATLQAETPSAHGMVCAHGGQASEQPQLRRQAPTQAVPAQTPVHSDNPPLYVSLQPHIASAVATRCTHLTLTIPIHTHPHHSCPSHHSLPIPATPSSQWAPLDCIACCRTDVPPPQAPTITVHPHLRSNQSHRYQADAS